MKKNSIYVRKIQGGGQQYCWANERIKHAAQPRANGAINIYKINK